MKIDWVKVILNAYAQGWFIWIGLVVIGFLFFKFSEYISVDGRDQLKKENAGIGLMGIGITIHIFAAIALINTL